MKLLAISFATGDAQVQLTKTLSLSELIQRSTQSMKQTFIAMSVFNRVANVYQFKINFKRVLQESLSTAAVYNFDNENEVGYIRYRDGSTMIFASSTYHYFPACLCHQEPQKCTFNLPLEM